MEDQIKAAIVAYLEANTCAAEGKKDWFLQFTKPIEKMFLSKIATEITNVIAPLLVPPPPDWDGIPDGFDWLAQDDDGMWYCYPTEPTQGHSFWEGKGRRVGKIGPVNKDWNKTLQQRPK